MSSVAREKFGWPSFSLEAGLPDGLVWILPGGKGRRAAAEGGLGHLEQARQLRFLPVRVYYMWEMLSASADGLSMWRFFTSNVLRWIQLGFPEL